MSRKVILGVRPSIKPWIYIEEMATRIFYYLSGPFEYR